MLKAGDKVPDLSVPDQDGKAVNLRDFKGKKVALYFYPKDQTPGCTAEACNLRDNYEALKKAGYVVFGVSSDDEKSHQKFIAKEKLPFALLADTDKKLHEAFGTWVEKSMYGRKYMGTARVTFIIAEDSTIEEVIDSVDTKNHAAQILKTAPPPKAKAPVKAGAKPGKPAFKPIQAKPTNMRRAAPPRRTGSRGK